MGFINRLFNRFTDRKNWHGSRKEATTRIASDPYGEDDSEVLSRSLPWFLKAVQILPPHQIATLQELLMQDNPPKDIWIALKDHPELESSLLLAMEIVDRDEADIPMFQEDLRRARSAYLSYSVNRTQDDLDAAVVAWDRILHNPNFQLTPAPFRAMVCSDGGLTFYSRYQAMGERDDLEASIRYLEEAVRLKRTNPLNMVKDFNNLGIVLSEYVAHSGAPGYLDQAVEVFKSALEISPDNSDVLTNLGGALRMRYTFSGELEDLSEAVEASENAVQRCPKDAPALPMYFGNLANGLYVRYQRTYEPGDLSRAVNCWQKAVALTPDSSPELSKYLSNLGVGLRRRYLDNNRKNPEDLRQAVEMHRRAIQLTPRASPLLPMYLNSLAGTLIYLSNDFRDSKFLDEAIDALDQAIRIIPEGSPLLPVVLASLGSALTDRYKHKDTLEDIEKAIKAYQEAAKQTNKNSPDLMIDLSGLGLALGMRYRKTKHQSHLEDAIRVYAETFKLLDRSFLLSPTPYQIGQQQRYSTAYSQAVDLYLLAASISPSVTAQHHRMAMTLAEGIKSRLFTTLLGRNQIPIPLTIPEGLRAKEQRLIGELVSLDIDSLTRNSLPGFERAAGGNIAHLKRRENLTNQAIVLWSEIQKYGPEAADYVALRRGEPLSYQDLTRLTESLGSKVALLSLLVRGDRTLIFVLRTGWEAPRVIESPMDQAQWNDLIARLVRDVHDFDRTGRRGETWDKPLLLLLENVAAHLSGIQHVIFVPHSVGHLLPWGALAQRAKWTAAVTVAPALGLLGRILQRPFTQSGEILIVGNPTEDLSSAEKEAHSVAKILGSKPLIGTQATKAAVLDRLSGIRLAHFATHAYFDRASPFDSGIVLADGILTAREIMEMRIQAPEVVVLSACETGLVGVLGGDELAGLSQALLSAGARTLLLSLWRVDDPVTAQLMGEFYQNWLKERLDKAIALKKAMETIRQAHPEWAHTYYWGAFILLGDWR